MFQFENAICYSGYRKNQSPKNQVFPSKMEVLEDLTMLAKHFKLIRMYDPYHHAQTVLEVIDQYQIPLKVMLGVEPKGEISNPNCPWGGLKSEEEIIQNRIENYQQLDLLLKTVNRFERHIYAISVGNECTSDWHGNLMPESSLIDHVRYLKSKTNIPITFNEGAYFWQTKCTKLANEVDFISIHSYPVWVKIPYQDSVKYTINDYKETKVKYPNKSVIFTEIGWPTHSDGPMIKDETDENHQNQYLVNILKWAKEENVLMFIFEAFNEPWKGSDREFEPEKHWGLWTEQRKPKLFAKSYIK